VVPQVYRDALLPLPPPLALVAMTMWYPVEAVAANAVHQILGRWPRRFEVRRMCAMALEPEPGEARPRRSQALREIWFASLNAPAP
jgi:hypothetical protein